MKCARLHLQERTTLKAKVKTPKSFEKPRRYCQKRLINPEHEEDPRWIDVLKRFHCNDVDNIDNNVTDSHQTNNNFEDLCLTVQTLKFVGNVGTEQVKRPKTSFKYKTVTNGKKHRMFVKQPIVENDFYDEDRSSQLTCYYFDDYVKYLFSNDRSRPNSGKSSIFLRGISATRKENKATQIDVALTDENKEQNAFDFKPKGLMKKHVKEPTKLKVEDELDTVKNSKIIYRSTGRRKSLTISRTQSPETVQVIRVDVVCNNIKTLSKYEENGTANNDINKLEPKNESFNSTNTHFADKYLLTNTVKSLDQKLTGGSKVTLLCKTFKLTDRAKLEKAKLEEKRQRTKSLKEALKNSS